MRKGRRKTKSEITNSSCYLFFILQFLMVKNKIAVYFCKKDIYYEVKNLESIIKKIENCETQQ